MTGADPVRVLLVEDSPGDACLIQEAIEEASSVRGRGPGFRITHSELLATAFAHLDARETDVVLLDLALPDSDAPETFDRVRARAPEVPIVVLSRIDDERFVSRAVRDGAQDYVLKSALNGEALVRSLRHAIERKRGEIERGRACADHGGGGLARDASWHVRGAEARTRALYDITSDLGAAITLEAIADIAVSRVLRALGAARGAMLAAAPGGGLRVARAHGYAPEAVAPYAEIPAGARVPAMRAFETGRPEFIEGTAEYAARYPHLAGEYAALGSRSLAALPMLAGGRVLGAIALSFTADRAFDAEDRAFMLTVAQQCGQALERARLFEAVRAERGRAEELNRLKDEFLATLSHELRTPLNAILGWARLMRSGGLSAPDQARGLETIERNARAQTRLVEDILDVSRVITGKLRIDAARVDLADVVAAGVDAVRPAADARRTRLAVACEAGPLAVTGDAARLQQVVWNLVSNAVKFTPPGGCVTVSVRAGESDVRLVVADDGQGIAPEFLPFVFDRFRQADALSNRANGGLGLGLAIVRHLVELHGGAVRAESAGAGRGATFTVTLPRHAADERGGGEAAGEPAGEGASEALAGTRVLVVDDDADALEMLAMSLELEGAEVVQAASADDAVAVIARWRPDVLVSDIGMPGRDGYDLIRAVRVLAPGEGGGVPAVALTGFASAEDSRRALHAGYQLHEPKPVDVRALAGKIAQLARREREARG